MVALKGEGPPGLGREEAPSAGLSHARATCRVRAGPMMAKREYPTAFPLKHALKDMRFALNLAEASDLPVSASATGLFAAADAAVPSLGDADFCAVMEAARAAAATGSVR